MFDRISEKRKFSTGRTRNLNLTQNSFETIPVGHLWWHAGHWVGFEPANLCSTRHCVSDRTEQGRLGCKLEKGHVRNVSLKICPSKNFFDQFLHDKWHFNRGAPRAMIVLKVACTLNFKNRIFHKHDLFCVRNQNLVLDPYIAISLNRKYSIFCVVWSYRANIALTRNGRQ